MFFNQDKESVPQKNIWKKNHPTHPNQPGRVASRVTPGNGHSPLRHHAMQLHKHRILSRWRIHCRQANRGCSQKKSTSQENVCGNPWHCCLSRSHAGAWPTSLLWGVPRTAPTLCEGTWYSCCDSFTFVEWGLQWFTALQLHCSICLPTHADSTSM